ncbi:hypothetical protein LTR22_024262 [Elasticomyces elasticus]|nr:hypothetical protein LTR22_024262 [Elasticomyces elasticus]KAK4899030.1 hypothetical protein LTR49_027727 [Elasticomyces elasticus]KAK5744105.1 hypothetical protein LTS12_023606 [Elasticomyces elasticus]
MENTHPTPGHSKPAENPGTVYTTERWAKGNFVDAGVSGIVELLPNGHIIKSPWSGWQEEERREDMAQEARAYQRLFADFGAHKRFVKLISYSETIYAITVEYMVNGTLRACLEAHNDRISQDQRHRWIQAMAEGMQMLRSANIVHCDFSPRNMLLDEGLQLKKWNAFFAVPEWQEGKAASEKDGPINGKVACNFLSTTKLSVIP